jgi:hypothetical protein
MEGLTDKQSGRQTDNETNGQTDLRREGWTDRRVDRQMILHTYIQMDEKLDGWMVRLTDRQTDIKHIFLSQQGTEG